MNATVAQLINEQINKEFYSAYLYLDFANYYAAAGLDGFENWYRVQAQEERDHALLLRLHLIPVFKSVQTHLRIVVGEVQIKVRRIEFLVDLLVNELCHRLIHILILTFIKMLFSKAGKHFTRPAFHMRYL